MLSRTKMVPFLGHPVLYCGVSAHIFVFWYYSIYLCCI